MFKSVRDFRERQTVTDELDDSWLVGTDRPACPITSHKISWQHNPNLEHKYVYRINSLSLLFWSSNNSFLIKIHHFSYLLVLYTLQESTLDDIHCWDSEGFYWSIIYLFIVFICGDLATSLPTRSYCNWREILFDFLITLFTLQLCFQWKTFTCWSWMYEDVKFTVMVFMCLNKEK